MPYTLPLRSAKSSTPVTAGAAVTCGSGSAMTSRSTVEEWTTMPRVPASRAPARPASSRPNPASVPSSGTLRRRYLTDKPSACSANVTFGHEGSGQRNRRTDSAISTGLPPAAPSATTRAYPP